MARLSTLKPTLGTLRPSIAFMPEGRAETDRHRNSQPWRKWYHTARWKALRWSVLVRDAFTCRGCEALEGDTSKLVADHIRPHRGDEALFWDEANLQTLCASCHSGSKQREERRAAP
ncbi:HNH endonuclease [Sphingomonas laterariae]|uniref:Putative HNH nuclease YajD n=1 Tax=Edaphosphingomonas laterariae TaxID=861865 RepID=A0A239F9R3_9SPHN|nr:HNH endonuclease signature motif containing protein [Sphingomonas laterariae]SNS53481.1 HNH endonuclease [Sphingomonas laterariae]